MDEHAHEREQMAGSTGCIAALAASALEQELSAPAGGKRDTKSARDLSAIIKDMVALQRELSAEPLRRGVTVRFEGETEEASQ